jgi:hypothetical protein
VEALQRQQGDMLRVTVLRNMSGSAAQQDGSPASLELDLDSSTASADAVQVKSRGITQRHHTAASHSGIAQRCSSGCASIMTRSSCWTSTSSEQRKECA